MVCQDFSSQTKTECWEHSPILVLQKLIKMIGLHHPTVFYQVVSAKRFVILEKK